MKHAALKKYEYHVWANQRVFSRMKELPDEIYDKEIRSVFPSIAKTLQHMYLTDVVWLNTMAGGTYEETRKLVGERAAQLNNKGISEMENEYDKLSKQYENFLASLDSLDLNIPCEHPEYGKYDAQYSELLEHVVNHGTYHRGNITAMLRQLGYSGPSTDYIYFLYETKSKAI